jgi:hypothetical protein
MAIYVRRREFIATLGGAATCQLAAAFALAPTASRRALAQGWPARPVRIVVPYAPGGSTDTVGITADRLSRIWGQQILIENKPGAGTNIGAAAVASSDPDGYTIFIGSSSLVTSRLLYRSLPYSLSDLAPATLMTGHKGKSAIEILGSPDDLKFRSCLTLFGQVASDISDRMLFEEALDQFYEGEPDSRTLELLRSMLSSHNVSP